MAIGAKAVFPDWFLANFVFYPPLSFFLSLMFCWDVFFQIDLRLLLILSFSDYLIIFTMFLVTLVFASMAIIGIAAKKWSSITEFLLACEVILSRVIRVLILILVPAAVLLPGGWRIAASLCAASVIVLAAALRMISAQRNNEVSRFRWAALFLLVGLSWIITDFGRIVGNVLISGPKRVYLLRLQDKVELYANVILFTSGGVIYKIESEVFFSPNDAVLFVRRTGMRKQM